MPNVRCVVFAYTSTWRSQAVYESDADSDLLETSEEEEMEDEEEENTSSQEESNDEQSDSDDKKQSHTARWMSRPQWLTLLFTL